MVSTIVSSVSSRYAAPTFVSTLGVMRLPTICPSMLRTCSNITAVRHGRWQGPHPQQASPPFGSPTIKPTYYIFVWTAADQQPHPPVLIGGGGEQLTLRVVAGWADRSNFGGTPEQFAHKCEVLKAHCQEVGRDYDEIEKTISGEVCIRETEAELRALGTKSLWGQPFDDWAAADLVGTPEQVCAKVETFVGLGARGFIPWCSDYPDDTTLRLLATRVMPEFTAPEPPLGSTP